MGFLAGLYKSALTGSIADGTARPYDQGLEDDVRDMVRRQTEGMAEGVNAFDAETNPLHGSGLPFSAQSQTGAAGGKNDLGGVIAKATGQAADEDNVGAVRTSDDKVIMQLPSGKFKKVPIARVKEALDDGLTFAAKQDVRERLDEKKYGNQGDRVALSELAKPITLGVSEFAERVAGGGLQHQGPQYAQLNQMLAAGIPLDELVKIRDPLTGKQPFPPELIQQWQKDNEGYLAYENDKSKRFQHNKAAGVTGMVVGNVVAGSRLHPLGAISDAAGAKAAAGILPEAVATTKLGGAAIGGLRGAGRGAVEGLVQSMGTVAEQKISQEPLGWESVAAGPIGGAFFGGIIGGGAGAWAARKAKNGVDEVLGTVNRHWDKIQESDLVKDALAREKMAPSVAARKASLEADLGDNEAAIHGVLDSAGIPKRDIKALSPIIDEYGGILDKQEKLAKAIERSVPLPDAANPANRAELEKILQGAESGSGLIDKELYEEGLVALSRRETPVSGPKPAEAAGGFDWNRDPTERLNVSRPAAWTKNNFSERVNEAASAVGKEGRYGDNKVFIDSVYQEAKARGFGGSLDDFKGQLAEAQHAGSVKLSRADLVEAMDPGQVGRSKTTRDGAEFHFVRVEGKPPAAAGKNIYDQPYWQNREFEKTRASLAERVQELQAKGQNPQRTIDELESLNRQIVKFEERQAQLAKSAPASSIGTDDTLRLPKSEAQPAASPDTTAKLDLSREPPREEIIKLGAKEIRRKLAEYDNLQDQLKKVEQRLNEQPESIPRIADDPALNEAIALRKQTEARLGVVNEFQQGTGPTPGQAILAEAQRLNGIIPAPPSDGFVPPPGDYVPPKQSFLQGLTGGRPWSDTISRGIGFGLAHGAVYSAGQALGLEGQGQMFANLAIGYPFSKVGARLAGKYLSSMPGKLWSGMKAAGARIGEKAISKTTQRAALQTFIKSYLPEDTKAKTLGDSVGEMASRIREMKANAEATQRKIYNALGEVRMSDPELAQQLEDHYMARLDYLESKAPQTQKLHPFMPKSEVPNDADSAAFARTVRAADNPTVLLDELADGQVNSETVETVKALYPRMFKEMEQLAVERLIGLQSLPFAQRFALQQVFNIPDPMYDPAFAASVNAFYTSKQPKDEEGPGSKGGYQVPTSSRNKKINAKSMSNNSTPAQRQGG